MHIQALPRAVRSLSILPLVLVAMSILSGCMGAMAPATTGLAPGLTAKIDRPGATMDRAAALSLVNHYRTTRGATALGGDGGLDAQAQTLATQYAQTGRPPALPAGTRAMRLSAGYETFADTFSGWRNSPADADVLALAQARRAGLAVVYDASSAYGTHWVLLLAD